MVTGQRVMALIADAGTSYRASYDLALEVDARVFHAYSTWDAKRCFVSKNTVLANCLGIPITMELPIELSMLLEDGLQGRKMFNSGVARPQRPSGSPPANPARAGMASSSSDNWPRHQRNFSIVVKDRCQELRRPYNNIPDTPQPGRPRPVGSSAGAPSASIATTDGPAPSPLLALSKELGRNAGTIAPLLGLPRPPRPLVTASGNTLDES